MRLSLVQFRAGSQEVCSFQVDCNMPFPASFGVLLEDKGTSGRNRRGVKGTVFVVLLQVLCLSGQGFRTKKWYTGRQRERRGSRWA